MAVPVTALAALGVQTLVAALITTLYYVALLMFNFAVPLRDGITILSYAAAIALAQASARWRGVAAAMLLFAVLWLEQFALSAPGRELFCDRSGGSPLQPSVCDTAALAFRQLWPIGVGVVAGALAARFLRTGPPGRLALPLGIAVYALVFPLARLATLPFGGPTPQGPPAAEAISWLISLQAAGAFAAGVLVGLLGRRVLLNALLFVAFFAGPWIPQIRLLGQVPRPFILSIDWQTFVPVGYAALALFGMLLGLGVTRVRRIRRTSAAEDID